MGSPAGRRCWTTNPLTWTSDPDRADASLHLGRAELHTGAEKRISKVDEGVTWAEIAADGRVLKQAGFAWHDEWSHFYFNIRGNAAERIDAFIAGRSVSH